MLLWRRIASYEEIHRARRALWGTATVAESTPLVALSPILDWEPEAAEEERTERWPGGRMRYLHARGSAPSAARWQKGATPQGSSGRIAKRVGPMAKYLSKEWVEAGRHRVENDPDFQNETQGIHASILCVIHEQPEHADEVFFIDFRDGKILDLYTGRRDAFDARGVRPTFEVHGDYNTFMQIQEGHLSQTTALMRGRLRLKGSLLKAMRYMRALETVTDILRKVPTEY